ncbi:Caudovirales tail fiber assembly protein [Pseudomonas sp. 5]|nr:Caudovirales tail fiber assembly protein [Pseudomonas sp. 5]
MKRFYSRTTGNCYLEGGVVELPPDAVLISDERFMAVIGNPAPGKVRSHDAEGLPILIDAPVYVPTMAELEGVERVWRDGQVSATEWLVTRHRDEQDMAKATTLTAEQFAALLVYRQAMRDWPQESRFPYSKYRPVAPPWIAEQTQ